MKVSIRWVLILGSLAMIWVTQIITISTSYVSSQRVLLAHAQDIMRNASATCNSLPEGAMMRRRAKIQRRGQCDARVYSFQIDNLGLSSERWPVDPDIAKTDRRCAWSILALERLPKGGVLRGPGFEAQAGRLNRSSVRRCGDSTR